MLTPPTHRCWWFMSDVTRNHHILSASTSHEIAEVAHYVMCAAHFWILKIGLLLDWTRVSIYRMWGFLDLSCLAHRLSYFYSDAIVPCVVHQPHLQYFKWPGSAAIVSHILRFIAVFHSLCMKEGEKQSGRGGWDAAVAVSWLVTFHWRSLQRLLVPVWEIRERHKEASWGESWSQPQIALFEAVSLPVMVVFWEASGWVFCPQKPPVFF